MMHLHPFFQSMVGTRSKEIFVSVPSLIEGLSLKLRKVMYFNPHPCHFFRREELQEELVHQIIPSSDGVGRFEFSQCFALSFNENGKSLR